MTKGIDPTKWYVHQAQVDGMGDKAHRYVRSKTALPFARRVCSREHFLLASLVNAPDNWPRCKKNCARVKP